MNQWLIILVALFVACSRGPCPRGQELQEIKYRSGGVRERGCVERASDNSYQRQGKWESFAEDGPKQMEVSYREGEKDGLQIEWYASGEKMLEVTFKEGERGPVTYWDARGIKLDSAPIILVPGGNGAMGPLQPR